MVLFFETNTFKLRSGAMQVETPMIGELDGIFDLFPPSRSQKSVSLRKLKFLIQFVIFFIEKNNIDGSQEVR